MGKSETTTISAPTLVEDERYRSSATELWASDNLQVDQDATVSVGEGGAWVHAWVWVSDSQTGIENG